MHFDDSPPYYTILINGREKQTTEDKLFPIGTVPPPMEEPPPASGFGFIGGAVSESAPPSSGFGFIGAAAPYEPSVEPAAEGAGA